jgi:hypothetical protein
VIWRGEHSIPLKKPAGVKVGTTIVLVVVLVLVIASR